MDANTFFGLAIGGIVIFVWGYDRVKGLFSHGKAAAPTTPAGLNEAAAAATPDAPLSTRAWLDYVNAQPDAVPHLAVIGPSGAGKSTFTTAVLSDRPGRIVVVAAKEGDHWGGLPYVGIDDDATYTTANATFAALDREVKQRLVAVKQKRLTADWLTIVLDDYSTLRIVCEAADEPFKLVARIGRSLRVRLVVLSDSASVKAWGIEGEGDTRASFAFVRLKRGRTGTLDIEEQAIPIDTSLTPRIASAAQLAARTWRPARDSAAELADLLGERDAKQFENTAPVSKAVSAAGSHENSFEISFETNDIAKIAAAIARNENQTKVIKSMPGYRADRHAAFVATYQSLRAQVEGAM
jgi:energy-coupling factor transporter ATP-binding protein EcfA2